MGTPTTNLTQANNTYALSDNFSKVIGSHSLKAGVRISLEQVNVNPNPTFNGSFAFHGSETGSDFADFLIGVPSQYNQADSQAYYGRHKYAGAFVQDSWRVRSDLTLNIGVRWDLMQYWSEKYNQIPALSLGQQSQVYPTAWPRTRLSHRCRSSQYAGAARQPTFAAPGTRVFAIEGRRFARDDSWRSGEDQHTCGLRHVLHRDSGQHHRDRRTAASLWLELHQPRASAVRHAVYQRGGRSRTRPALSSDVSAAERVAQSSQSEHRLFSLRAAGGNDVALPRQHLPLQRELFFLDSSGNSAPTRC